MSKQITEKELKEYLNNKVGLNNIIFKCSCCPPGVLPMKGHVAPLTSEQGLLLLEDLKRKWQTVKKK